MPGLRLLRGDRVEPSSLLPAVADVYGLRVFPVQVLFWRRRSETRIRHRNPLFDANIGITVAILTMDHLHAVNLGVLKELAARGVWELVLCDAFRTRETTQDSLVESSCLAIVSEFKAFARRSSMQELISSKFGDLTPKMLGQPAKPKLARLKAAETRGLSYFLRECFGKYGESVSRADVWHAAFDSLCVFFDIIRGQPWLMSSQSRSRLRATWRRYTMLHDQLGIPDKPKVHLVEHVIGSASFFGNPATTACFLDESLNKVLGDIGRAVHTANAEADTLARYRELTATPEASNRRGRKRQRDEG